MSSSRPEHAPGALADAVPAAWEQYRAGQVAQAESICRRILAQQPDRPDALHLLGVIANQTGHGEQAIALLSRAVHLKPDAADIHASLALAFHWLNRMTDAERSYRQTLLLNPGHGGAQLNLGAVLEAQGKLSEALEAFGRAVELQPGSSLAELNFGTTLRRLGRVDEALPHLRRSIELGPEHAQAHVELAWLLLLKGDLAHGWMEYEWRWRCPEFKWPAYRQPLWDGSSLSGRTILLHSEQGMGDAIQFVRYAGLISQHGGKAVVLCPERMRELLATGRGVLRTASRIEELGAFDTWCPMMSLPLRFGTMLQTIPANIPYIAVDPQRVEHWAKRLGDRTGLRIGLCWAGSPANVNDLNRSIPLEAMTPLSQVSGVRLISLQKEFRGPAPFHLEVLEDLDEPGGAFLDSAAVMQHLDLVISADTAIAHLAGALGKPVWTLLPFAPDWRWLLEGERSPWYPTMRLVRRKRDESWSDVVTRLSHELVSFSP